MRIVFCIFFLFCDVSLHAQGHFLLHIIPADKDTGFLTKDFSYKRDFRDTLSRTAEMKNLINKLYKESYLEATFDSITEDSNRLTASLFIGKQWEWATLSNGNVDDVILDRIGFHEKLYDGKPFSSSLVNSLLNEVLGYCENNGYPFAAVRLDSISINGQQLTGKIFLTKNKLITIDSIVVSGTAKISNKYLANYLGLRLPAVYKEDVVKKITTRLNELPFLSEERPSQIQFRNNSADILLFLKKKNASSFDFVLGVLPNSNTTGKLVVTGDGQLNLNNAFGKGEVFYLRFNQLPAMSTQVLLKGSYPYLFNFPFGIDVEFDLYKNDTLYLDVKEQIGLQYLFKGVDYFKFYFRNESNSVLTLDTTTIIQTKTLPSILDINTKYYGVEFLMERLDYRLNPQQGISLYFNGKGGNRNVKQNAQIVSLQDPEDPSYNFSSLYDSVNLKSTQFRLMGRFDKYWKLTGRSSFKTSYNGGGIRGGDIYSNERYHIGGFRLLRGFDEETIFVTQYHVITVEYHYLISRNSFFYLFFDGSYIEDKSVAPFFHDTPYGFGAGFNFETKAGIFGLSYALGHQQNNPIEFRAAKIHFGYVNYF